MPVDVEWPHDQGLDADLLLAASAAFAETGQQRLAVAVSGGGDSIALLHLMQRAAAQRKDTVYAVTVDHGLRPAAAHEALGVAQFCETLGIAHTTLTWRDRAATGNLMDQARQARTQLMGNWARAVGISYIVLGHTADDEAETFLMGLARASGLDGLAGMRSRWWQDGLKWSRPLLRHSRASLRDYLRRHKIAWVDDPTNEDDHYARVKARKALAVLGPLGITLNSLTTSIGHLAAAQHALQQGLHAAVKASVTTPAGTVQITQAGFADVPVDLQRRLLLAAIAWLSSDPYPPRMAKQNILMQAVQDARDTTLNGCRIRHAADRITITREPRAIAASICATDQLWDNRWQCIGPHAPGLTLRALGAEGLRACKKWRYTGLSRDALLVTPAVWRGDALISAPLVGFNPEWSAAIPIGFDKFILSH